MQEYVIKIVVEIPESESFVHEELLETIHDMGLKVKFMSSKINLDTGDYCVFEYFDTSLLAGQIKLDTQYDI